MPSRSMTSATNTLRPKRNKALPLVAATLASLTITRNIKTGKNLLTVLENSKSTFDPSFHYAPTANFTKKESPVKSYVNLWKTRFASSKARNKTGGYVFFKHMRSVRPFCCALHSSIVSHNFINNNNQAVIFMEIMQKGWGYSS